MALARRRGSILVVEDDRDTREMFGVALKAAGFHVVAVPDGADALRIIDVVTPSLIVLDLALPRVSGADVVREVASRADSRHMPIVVVTGAEPGTLPRSAVARVLRKPVAPDLLVSIVERCVDDQGGMAFPQAPDRFATPR